jgi:hypothetical protein
MIPRHLRSALLLITGSVLATGLFAQTPAPKLAFPEASPTATLKQRVGVTDIEINYNAPQHERPRHLRQIGALRRGLAHRRQQRHASITFSTDVKLHGAALAAGTYELFSIPGPSEWSVIFQKNMSNSGAPTPTTRRTTPRVKTKSVALAAAGRDAHDRPSTTSAIPPRRWNIAWDKTRLPVKVEVDVVSQLSRRSRPRWPPMPTRKPYFAASDVLLSRTTST